jgi:hypothetical protein
MPGHLKKDSKETTRMPFLTAQWSISGVGRGSCLIPLAHFGSQLPPRQTPNPWELRLPTMGMNTDGELVFDFSKY